MDTMTTCNNCEVEVMVRGNSMGYCQSCFDDAARIEYLDNSQCQACGKQGRTYFTDIMGVKHTQHCLSCLTVILGVDE